MATGGAKIEADQLLDALGRLELAVEDPSDAMRAIGNTVAEDARLNFEDETDPWGQKWEPLAASTKRQRRGDGEEAEILRDSSALFNSIDYQLPDAQSVEVGAGTGPSAVYGAIHQFGGKAGPNHRVEIPARPYLPITEAGVELPAETEKNVLDVIDRHLGKALG